MKLLQFTEVNKISKQEEGNTRSRRRRRRWRWWLWLS
jgi:hypothetical protein